MKTVTLYTKPNCPFCLGAKNLLADLKVGFTEIDVGADPLKRQELIEQYNWPTVPIIVVGDKLIGGFDDLEALTSRGEFLSLLND